MSVSMEILQIPLRSCSIAQGYSESFEFLGSPYVVVDLFLQVKDKQCCLIGNLKIKPMAINVYVFCTVYMC